MCLYAEPAVDVQDAETAVDERQMASPPACNPAQWLAPSLLAASSMAAVGGC